MLESKAIPANYTVYCPGSPISTAARSIAITRTVWSIFTRASSPRATSTSTTSARLLGIDRISAICQRSLGLGRRTGIDFPGEEPGLIPSEEWVERVNHHKWYPGSTISVAIGQGAGDGTPVQLARMIAAVASGGTI